MINGVCQEKNIVCIFQFRVFLDLVPSLLPFWRLLPPPDPQRTWYTDPSQNLKLHQRHIRTLSPPSFSIRDKVMHPEAASPFSWLPLSPISRTPWPQVESSEYQLVKRQNSSDKSTQILFLLDIARHADQRYFYRLQERIHLNGILRYSLLSIFKVILHEFPQNLHLHPLQTTDKQLRQNFIRLYQIRQVFKILNSSALSSSRNLTSLKIHFPLLHWLQFKIFKLSLYIFIKENSVDHIDKILGKVVATCNTFSKSKSPASISRSLRILNAVDDFPKDYIRKRWIKLF